MCINIKNTDNQPQGSTTGKVRKMKNRWMVKKKDTVTGSRKIII